MADCLEAHTQAILAQNQLDVAAATGTITPVMIDRLTLTPGRISDMAAGIRAVAALPDPVGEILSTHTLPNGLVVEKTAIPLGVVAIIYESRPNVTSDAASLAIKSGNVCVLRGGKESFRSNQAIVSALQEALRRQNLPESLVTHNTQNQQVTEYWRPDDKISRTNVVREEKEPQKKTKRKKKVSSAKSINAGRNINYT